VSRAGLACRNGGGAMRWKKWYDGEASRGWKDGALRKFSHGFVGKDEEHERMPFSSVVRHFRHLNCLVLNKGF
jgi:hypothetical protein